MTFIWTPDFGAAKASKPTITPVKFGDGYEQRAAAGLNTNPKSWNLTFSKRDISEADSIEAFLDALGGIDSFDWAPPRASATIKVVCREWSRTADNAAMDTVTAKFEQVFEP